MKDLTTFTLSVIQELEDEGRFGTAHVYRSMLRAFQRYWESEHPKNEIRMRKVFDIATIHKFERHLLERMLKLNTMSTYLRMLRAVYNRALLAGLTGIQPRAAGRPHRLRTRTVQTCIYRNPCRRETRTPTCRNGTSTRHLRFLAPGTQRSADMVRTALPLAGNAVCRPRKAAQMRFQGRGNYLPKTENGKADTCTRNRRSR